MRFFFMTVVFMYVGRKIGWAISKAVLYTASMGTAIVVSVIWGAVVAFLMFVMIGVENPNIILKIIMGYALGWYVAVPNFGLIAEGSIPDEAKPRHILVSTVPSVTYIVAMVVLSLAT